MGEKKNDFFTIGIVAVILMVFTCMDLLAEAGLLAKNPYFTQDPRPVLSAGKLWDGTFFEDYAGYVDQHFFNRTKWGNIVRTLDFTLGKREVNEVYLGKKETLLERHLVAEYGGKAVSESLDYLEKLSSKYGAKIMLIPTSDEIWRDRLPLYADSFDQKAYLSQVEERVGGDFYVDAYSVLKEHAEKDVYYRTDPHWTSLGAYYGYYAWWKNSGKRMPHYYNPDQMATVTDKFRGVLYGRVGAYAGEERLSVLKETLARQVSVTYDNGVTVEGFYRQEYLSGANPYGYFLGDGFGFAEIDTGRERSHSLLVVGDSYCNCMIPLLAPHYQTIYVVNPKYYQGDLWELLEGCGESDAAEILVLESVTGLLDEFRQE